MVAGSSPAGPTMPGLADHLSKMRPPAWKRRPEVLLQNNTVKPLHQVTPRSILGKTWWDRTRQAAYEATDFHCIACGVPKRLALWHPWLEGHEVYDIDYHAGRMTYIETVALCHSCHCFIHCGRLEALVLKGEATQEKYDMVMTRGNLILKEANLRKPRQYIGRMAKWEDWRLVLYGNEYPPVFVNHQAWLVGHGYGEEE